MLMCSCWRCWFTESFFSCRNLRNPFFSVASRGMFSMDSIPARWARVQLPSTFILTAERSPNVQWAQVTDRFMLPYWVPTPLFGHFMRQPSSSGGSCSKPLLQGVLCCSRFSLARLWNRSVFRVGDPLQRDGCTCQRADIILFNALA